MAEPRFATFRNPDRRTLGPEVAEVMAELGEPAMPWQAEELDVAYELDEEATEEASTAAGSFRPRLWYRENRLTVPRQSGKTTKAKARHIHRMRKSREYGWAARPLSFYMAQTATDAREKLVEEWMPALEESPYWLPNENGKALPESPIQQFIRSNGREAIRWLGGGRITVKPPSRTGGHGGSPDLIDLDEAFAHRTATAEQGVRPGMITKVSPQLWVVSTAGTAESEYLWGKVDDGRSMCESPNPESRVSYREYSAYPGECNTPILGAATDIELTPEVLARCSPAMGHTIRLVDLLADISGMPLDEALRAYGNIWTSSVRRVIPAAAWDRCLSPGSQIVGRMWLAVDASPGAEGGRSASIAVAGYNEYGQIHVEVIANGPGLLWVPPRVHELTRKHRTIERLYYDPAGPVRAIAPDLKENAACLCEPLEAAEMTAACQRLHEDVVNDDPGPSRLVHIGQAVLDQAVEGAAKRQLLDSWAWARRRSTADISPLVACTETYWAAVNNPARKLEMF